MTFKVKIVLKVASSSSMFGFVLLKFMMFHFYYIPVSKLHSILGQEAPHGSTGAAVFVPWCRRKSRGSISNRRLRACANSFRPMAPGMCAHSHWSSISHPAGAQSVFFSFLEKKIFVLFFFLIQCIHVVTLCEFWWNTLYLVFFFAFFYFTG